MEHDDVERLDRVLIGGDVVEAPIHSILEPAFPEQMAGLAVVRGRAVQFKLLSAPVSAADLDLAEPAADLKHHRALDAALNQRLVEEAKLNYSYRS